MRIPRPHRALLSTMVLMSALAFSRIDAQLEDLEYSDEMLGSLRVISSNGGLIGADPTGLLDRLILKLSGVVPLRLQKFGNMFDFLYQSRTSQGNYSDGGDYNPGSEANADDYDDEEDYGDDGALADGDYEPPALGGKRRRRDASGEANGKSVRFVSSKLLLGSPHEAKDQASFPTSSSLKPRDSRTATLIVNQRD